MAKMMKGQSNHTLDAKSRLIIPTRLRAGLGERFTLCKGMDKNIYIYPEEEWEKFSEKLNALPISDKAARAFKIHFQGCSADAEVDSQYRICIPQDLREYANIGKDVVLVGNGNIAEIWDKAAFEKLNEECSENIDEISASISEKYGI